jgi:hypothetical protein
MARVDHKQAGDKFFVAAEIFRNLFEEQNFVSIHSARDAGSPPEPPAAPPLRLVLVGPSACLSPTASPRRAASGVV